MVELPVDPSGSIAASLKVRPVNNKNYSKTSLLLLNDGKNYQAYIMTIIADSSYLKNGGGKLANNTYKHIDKNFTGVLSYFTPKGQLVCTYVFSNGGFSKLLAPSLPATSVLSSSAPPTQGSKFTSRNLDVNCYEYYIDYTYDDGFSYEVILGGFCLVTDDNIQSLNPDITDGGAPPPDAGTTTITPVKIVIPIDSCDGAKTAAATTANTINGNASVTNAFNAAIANGNNGSESAFHIDKSGGTITASTPAVTATETATYSTTNTDPNTFAIGHDHVAGYFPTPSPYDAYSLGNLSAQTGGAISTDYVVSPTAKYAVVVSDLTAYNSFNAANGDTYLAKDANGNYTGDFDNTKGIGQDIYKIEQNSTSAYLAYHAVDVNNPTNAEISAATLYGLAVGLVYFTDNYSTGLTILQADANGNFQPLHFTSQTSSTGVVVYFFSPCN